MPDNVVRLRNYGGRMLKFVNRQRLRSFIAFTVQNNIIMDSLFFSISNHPSKLLRQFHVFAVYYQKTSCVDVLCNDILDALHCSIVMLNKCGYDISIPRRRNFEHRHYDDQMLYKHSVFGTISVLTCQT